MKPIVTTLAGAVLALGTLTVAAAATVSATSPSTLQPCQTDYPPSPDPQASCETTTTTSTTTTTTTIANEPRLEVKLLSPVCDHDTPYLQYAVVAHNAAPGADTVTITFVNPNGPDAVYSGLPLSGRVLWPGAEVDANGNPTDWPGWTQLADGSWSPGDEWNWARGTVAVHLEVNPEATLDASYPPATPSCAADPRPETPRDDTSTENFVLPETA